MAGSMYFGCLKLIFSNIFFMASLFCYGLYFLSRFPSVPLPATSCGSLVTESCTLSLSSPQVCDIPLLYGRCSMPARPSRKRTGDTENATVHVGKSAAPYMPSLLYMLICQICVKASTSTHSVPCTSVHSFRHLRPAASADPLSRAIFSYLSIASPCTWLTALWSLAETHGKQFAFSFGADGFGFFHRPLVCDDVLLGCLW